MEYMLAENTAGRTSRMRQLSNNNQPNLVPNLNEVIHELTRGYLRVISCFVKANRKEL